MLVPFQNKKGSLTPTHSIILANYRCKNACYIKDDQMSQLSKRGASFGSGKKSDFTKPLTCSPPSTLYMYKSVFEDGKNRGKSFGASRDRSPDRSYFIPQIHKNPGPGNVSLFLM